MLQQRKHALFSPAPAPKTPEKHASALKPGAVREVREVREVRWVRWKKKKKHIQLAI